LQLNSFESFTPQIYEEIKAVLPKKKSGAFKLDPAIFAKANNV
jgi:hypothetical protein